MKKGLIILVHIFGILLVLFGVGLQSSAAEEGKTKLRGRGSVKMYCQSEN